MIANDAFVLLIKATVVLGAGLAAGRLLRRGSATARHHVWSATLAAALVLPALAFLAPHVRIPVPGWREQAAVPATFGAMPAVRRSVDRSPAPKLESPVSSTNAVPSFATTAIVRSRSPFHAPSLLALLGACWLIGAIAVLARLALALRRVSRLARASFELTDAAWLDAGHRLARPLGLRGRVRLLVSPGVVTPMAGGVVRPTIFLPQSAPTWSDEVRDVVLAHEMAHLASRDPVRHVVSRAALALYWFHPFAWLVVKRAVTTCEQACDHAVLTLGIRPSTYAAVLLDFASSGAAPAFAAALPIVRQSQLEDRLMAILNFSRRASGRRNAIVTAAIAIVATPLVAAIEPARVSTQAPIAAGASAPLTMAASLPASTTLPAAGPLGHAALGAAGGAAAQANAPHAQPPADDACTWDGNGGNFSGTIVETGNSRDVQRRIGTSDNSRVIQTSFGDLRVCAVGEGMASDTSDAVPSAWPARATRVLLETRGSGGVRRMAISGGHTTYTVNDQTRPVDTAALAWRDKLLALLDPTWELSELHGRVSSLRGEISSIEGQRSSMEGEISSLRGQVSSMRGEISSVGGQVSSMEGEISSVRGHLSSLRGEISSERGAISSLEASGGSDTDVRRHEDNIRGIEKEITNYDADGRVRQIEARIAAFNADSQVNAIEQRIRAFNVDSQVDAVEKRIQALDVEGQTNRIEREIDALHEGTRGSELQARVDAAERQLRDLLGGH